MTTDAILFVKLLFSTAYTFMSSFYLPGTHVTPLELSMASLFIWISWKMFIKLCNFGVDPQNNTWVRDDR